MSQKWIIEELPILKRGNVPVLGRFFLLCLLFPIESKFCKAFFLDQDPMLFRVVTMTGLSVFDAEDLDDIDFIDEQTILDDNMSGIIKVEEAAKFFFFVMAVPLRRGGVKAGH